MVIASTCFTKTDEIKELGTHLKLLMQNAWKVDLPLQVYINYVLEDGIVEIENIVLERCNH